MGSLTKLQVHMLTMLINEPLEAFKLRNKYTKTFDYMFKYVFNTSFGVEIEINPNFYKNLAKGRQLHRDDNKHVEKMNKIEYDIDTMFKCRRYVDGNCHEYTFPVRAQNLHVVYKYLKQIRSHLIGDLGVGNFDTSSSMHIHMSAYPLNISKVYAGIPVLLENRRKLSKNPLVKKEGNCSAINIRYLYLTDSQIRFKRENCNVCFGCDTPLLNDTEIINEEALKSIVKERIKTSVIDSRSLGIYSYRLVKLLLLLSKGEEYAEELYTTAFELFDLKYKDKLAFILGRFDDKEFERKLEYSIAYFIPYSCDVFGPNLGGWINVDGGFGTHEVRLFPGSTNFSIIMKRAMMYSGLNQLMSKHDSTILKLFLKII